MRSPAIKVPETYSTIEDVPRIPAGAANNYTATVPAGRVGVWAGPATASAKFDNFKLLDMSALVDVDGRWWDDVGDTSLSGGKLRIDNSSEAVERHVVRRGFRGGKYVFEYEHPFDLTNINGAILHYQDPENFMAVVIGSDDPDSIRLMRRKDGVLSTIANATLTMVNGYTVRCAIHDDPGDSSLQELKVYVNGTLRLTSTAIDDDWSAGMAGLICLSAGSGTLDFDNVKIGLDNNADDDIADAGDDILVSDTFASNVMSLTYDNNGNLTGDGLLSFVYDAWNRLVETKLGASGDSVSIATYAYDGQNRRTKKVVTNHGVEQVANDGGNTTVLFYYDNLWRMVETRNGSNQTIAQYFWGTQYVDEILYADVNGDPTESNDCDPDDQTGESTADTRYFYHQDRNWNVVALSQYSETGDAYAGLVERYRYTPYGEFVVLKGDSSGNELGNVLLTSSVGNVFAHQGLTFDREAATFEFEGRRFDGHLKRFTTRAPTVRYEALNRYDSLSTGGCSPGDSPPRLPTVNCNLAGLAACLMRVCAASLPTSGPCAIACAACIITRGAGCALCATCIIASGGAGAMCVGANCSITWPPPPPSPRPQPRERCKFSGYSQNVPSASGCSSGWACLYTCGASGCTIMSPRACASAGIRLCGCAYEIFR
jgi:hypothetical protein